MDILQTILNQAMQSKATETISKNLKADKKQIESATGLLIPSLLDGLNQNAQSDKGLASLMGALDDHGSANISDMSGFLGNVDLGDGQKILGHIFGKKTDNVTKDVAKKSGLSQANTAKLMMMLAPLVMGYLGNQKKQAKGGFDAGSLIGMLAKGSAGSVLGGMLASAMAKPKAAPKVKPKPAAKKQDDLVGNVTDILGSLISGKKK